MIKILLILILVLSGCSPTDKEVKIEKKNKNLISKNNNLQDKIIKNNFNPDLEIKLGKKIEIKSFRKLRNNYGRHNIQEFLFNQKNFKLKKIKNFTNFNANIVFDKTGIIFFENNGTLLKYDYSKNLIWKKNYYSKQERKSKILINFSIDKNNLIISDNISKYYKINPETGELIWMKRISSRFNSQIKIYNDKFYAIDSENVIYSISIKNGKILWNYKTENFFIKSKKKLSILIDDEIIIFNNSIGDITALNSKDGSFLWQTPTQNNQIYAESILLSTSDLVLDEDAIFFSNNKNEFYSLNKNNGFVNWKQTVNSDIRPIVVGKNIFTVSNEGFLLVIDRINGNILTAKDLFENFSQKKRELLKPTGVIMGAEHIFMTVNNGRLFVLKINNGNLLKIIKLDNKPISKPFIFNQKVYIAKDNSIIELN